MILVDMVRGFFRQLILAMMPKSMRKDYLLVYFLSQDNQLTTKYVKPSRDSFRIGKARYEIHTNLIYRLGSFRTPVSIYVENDPTPKSLRENEPLELTARENYERMESHVASDALNAFNNPLAEQMPIFLLLIAVVAVGGFIWWNMTQSFTELEALIQSGRNIVQR